MKVHSDNGWLTFTNENIEVCKFRLADAEKIVTLLVYNIGVDAIHPKYKNDGSI